MLQGWVGVHINHHNWRRWRQGGQLLAQAQKAEQLQLSERALERYLQVLARQPEQAEALIRASELLIKGGNFAKAQPLLLQRLETDSNNPDLLIQTSRCCFEVGAGVGRHVGGTSGKFSRL